jgi:hypothetical protein
MPFVRIRVIREIRGHSPEFSPQLRLAINAVPMIASEFQPAEGFGTEPEGHDGGQDAR